MTAWRINLSLTLLVFRSGDKRVPTLGQAGVFGRNTRPNGLDRDGATRMFKALAGKIEFLLVRKEDARS